MSRGYIRTCPPCLFLAGIPGPIFGFRWTTKTGGETFVYLCLLSTQGVLRKYVVDLVMQVTASLYRFKASCEYLAACYFGIGPHP